MKTMEKSKEKKLAIGNIGTRHSLRSACSRGLLRPLRGSTFGLGQPDDFVAGAFPHGSRTPARGGYGNIPTLATIDMFDCRAMPNLNGNVARSDTQGDIQGDTQGDAKAQKRNVDLMLVEWIAADPKVTVKVLAERLKCSVVTVKRHIAKLQNIRYVGHGYSGHWEVV